MQSLLAKKRRGLALTEDEIEDFIKMVSSGKAEDAQIGAMLMAISINGMTPKETADLTKSMVKSGRQLDWPGLVADKHSTGGVGDKVSIPLAPILAELGLVVPMISGRGLEITGGTLDKLESIPGYNVNLTVEQMAECLKACGCFIAATTGDLCPADRKTYVIRDVTSTVDCTPLVTGSILSKKLAEGAKYLIQDIKVGEAAFYKDVESARDLANTMILTAKYFGLDMVAVLSKMDQPIGRCVGNSLEIEESVDILRGDHYPKNLTELILGLGGRLIMKTGLAKNLDEAKEKMLEVIKNGKALKKFETMLTYQGVNKDTAKELCYGNKNLVLPKAKYTTEFKSKQKGYVNTINALIVGTICFKLGSGRNNQSDTIDFSVGCELLVAQGEEIEEGKTWAILHHNRPLTEDFKEKMASAISIVSTPVTNSSIIIESLNG